MDGRSRNVNHNFIGFDIRQIVNDDPCRMISCSPSMLYRFYSVPFIKCGRVNLLTVLTERTGNVYFGDNAGIIAENDIHLPCRSLGTGWAASARRSPRLSRLTSYVKRIYV